jgi:hypothetical protein
MAGDGLVSAVRSEEQAMGAIGEAQRTKRQEIRCESWRLRRGRRPEAHALSDVRKRELRAPHTVMSATWAERVMQKPSILEWMAWRRYLTATRASSALAYPLIEEAAWARLREDLARVGSPLFSDPPFVAEQAASQPRQARAASSGASYGLA